MPLAPTADWHELLPTWRRISKQPVYQGGPLADRGCFSEEAPSDWSAAHRPSLSPAVSWPVGSGRFPCTAGSGVSRPQSPARFFCSRGVALRRRSTAALREQMVDSGDACYTGRVIEGGFAADRAPPCNKGRFLFGGAHRKRKVGSNIWPKERLSGSATRRGMVSSPRMTGARISSCTTAA